MSAVTFSAVAAQDGIGCMQCESEGDVVLQLQSNTRIVGEAIKRSI